MHKPFFAVAATRRRELIEALLGDEHPSFQGLQVGSADLPLSRVNRQKGEVTK